MIAIVRPLARLITGEYGEVGRHCGLRVGVLAKAVPPQV